MLTHGTLDAHAAVWDGVEFGHWLNRRPTWPRRWGKLQCPLQILIYITWSPINSS